MIRENREHYQVVIQAKDMAGQMGGLSGTATVNITLLDVNNSPPRFPHSKQVFHVHVVVFRLDNIYAADKPIYQKFLAVMSSLGFEPITTFESILK